MKELAGSHSRILRARHFHMVDCSKRLLFFGPFFHWPWRFEFSC